MGRGTITRFLVAGLGAGAALGGAGTGFADTITLRIASGHLPPEPGLRAGALIAPGRRLRRR